MRRWIVIALLVCCVPLMVIRAEDLIHTVREGETLTSIAARYGVSVSAIAIANKLSNEDALYVGQRLIIPVQGTSGISPSVSSVPSAPGTYTVQPGDTLYGIANKLGISPDALITANKITDPALLQVGRVLKIPGAAESTGSGATTGSAVSALPDGRQTVAPAATGPTVTYEISGGRLTSLTLETTSTGKQGYPLSCESKVAGQIAAMYGLSFDETRFLNSLPHSLNPRRGFVGSAEGRFYYPRDLIDGTANGPGGYGVHVEGWSPTFQALSGFGVRLLASDSSAAGIQIDAALRHGQPVAVWAVLEFRENVAARSVWLGSGADGKAIDCGRPGKNCYYLVSGEHTYLVNRTKWRLVPALQSRQWGTQLSATRCCLERHHKFLCLPNRFVAGRDHRTAQRTHPRFEPAAELEIVIWEVSAKIGGTSQNHGPVGSPGAAVRSGMTVVSFSLRDVQWRYLNLQERMRCSSPYFLIPRTGLVYWKRSATAACSRPSISSEQSQVTRKFMSSSCAIWQRFRRG